MVFFDLNIPFLESPEQATESFKTGRKNVRLKLVVKAMELGYSGVAYNRSIKGVMSDLDRCEISLFPLSSLLKAAPALSTSVRFHRELLGVRLDSPFRQYTRLTVAVESAVHASALNSGNPVLRTYDLVAVRPLNQIAFDQACKVSEVDLISINFSQKLPFRLKCPMVKSAIERGVYFEITYSHLISDVQARRQMLSGAKLLVDWTRGKNLIFSSAAPTANELRGPYDVSNLSSLLGVSMERAKEAISKNCRSLIVNALRKKQCYKEAIKIDKISNGEQLNSKGDWFGNWHGWDPISSVEGDLSLDDIGRFLSAAHNMPKNSNGIDVISVEDGMSQRHKQLNDQFSISGRNFLSLDTSLFYFGAVEVGSPATTNKGLKQSDKHDVVSVADWMPLPDTKFKGPITWSEGNLMSPIADGMPLAGTPLKYQISCSVGDQMLPNDARTVIPTILDLEPSSGCEQGPNRLNGFDVVPVALKKTFECRESDNCISGSKDNLLLTDNSLTFVTASKDMEPSVSCNEDPEQANGLNIVSGDVGMPSYVTPSKDCSDTNLVPLDEILTLSSANLLDVSEACNEDPRRSNRFDADLAECETPVEQKQQDVIAPCHLQEDLPKIELRERGDDAVSLVDVMMSGQAFDERKDAEKGDLASVEDDLTLEDAFEMKERKQEVEVQQRNRALSHKARPVSAVKGKHKRRSRHLGRPWPFLSMSKPLFKRKASQPK